MTYSIVARDPATGQLGVAVQSHFFGVGSVCPYAEAGVGAVCTQAFAEAGYGPRGLRALAEGRDARSTLDSLLAADPERELRQVALVDATGQVAVHTGARCIPSADHRTGAQVSVQGNMLASAHVVPAMLAAYEAGTGSLEDRLLAALHAADAAGGDARGRQSAALLVVSGQRGDQPWQEVIADVRTEDSADPVAELHRLVRMRRAFAAVGSALFGPLVLGDAGALSPEEADAALADLAAAQDETPGNPEPTTWRVVALARLGRLDDARAAADGLLAAHPELRSFLLALVEGGLLEESVLAAANRERAR